MFHEVLFFEFNDTNIRKLVQFHKNVYKKSPFYKE